MIDPVQNAQGIPNPAVIREAGNPVKENQSQEIKKDSVEVRQAPAGNEISDSEAANLGDETLANLRVDNASSAHSISLSKVLSLLE